jgi:anti-sigma regulatory factor (Ser/Thr protein kinase)
MTRTPDQRTDRVRYPSHRAQVKNARQRTARVLGEWGLSDDTTAAVVAVVDELVVNAVIHARVPRGREVGVALRLLDTVVRVEVRDADRTEPNPCKPLDLTNKPSAQDIQEIPEGGRGLLLVELLSERWGCLPEIIGKTVWAEIPHALAD